MAKGMYFLQNVKYILHSLTKKNTFYAPFPPNRFTTPPRRRYAR